MNEKAAVSHQLNAKHRKILKNLLKLPENRECADCRSRAPRWASVNLGIFICMQCSGIHRSLGVHISKVRSATLDTWLPEQVAFIQSMGNEKANSYWEAELPPNYDRVLIENFIRAKYQEKKWIPREGKVKSSPRMVGTKSSTQHMDNKNVKHDHQVNGQHHWDERRPSHSPNANGRTIAESKIADSPEIKQQVISNPERFEVVEKPKSAPISAHALALVPAAAPTPEPASASAWPHPRKEQPPTSSPATSVPNVHEAAEKPKPESAPPGLQAAKQQPPTTTPTPSPPPKVDYATELFSMLCMDDCKGNGNWIDFSDTSSTIDVETKSPSVGGRTSAEDVKSDNSSLFNEVYLKTMETSHRMPPFQTHQLQNGSVYRKVSSIAAPVEAKYNGHLQNSNSKLHQTGYNGFHTIFQQNGRTTGNQSPRVTQIPNGQQTKVVGSFPYAIQSQSCRPGGPINGSIGGRAAFVPNGKPRPSITPTPSGHDYDFSSLTKDMFTKR